MDDFKKKYNLKGKRVLVTGSNGFIGKHLVKRLAKEEAEIYCIDINKNKSKQEVTKRYIVNIGDFKKLEGIIKKINPEIIFHLAAIVNPSRKINGHSNNISLEIEALGNLTNQIILNG